MTLPSQVQALQANSYDLLPLMIITDQCQVVDFKWKYLYFRPIPFLASQSVIKAEKILFKTI